MGFRTWGTIEAEQSAQKASEEKRLGQAASTQSLWGTLGSTLGTWALPILMGATGPLGIAAASALGSGLGGALGRGGAAAGGARLEGGEYLGSEAKELRSKIGGDLLTGAITGGVTAGMGEMLEGAKAAKTAYEGALEAAGGATKIGQEGVDKLREAYKYNPLKAGKVGIHKDIVIPGKTITKPATEAGGVPTTSTAPDITIEGRTEGVLDPNRIAAEDWLIDLFK